MVLYVVLVNVEVNQTDTGQRTDNICDTIEMDIYGIEETPTESENIDEQVHDRCTLGTMQDCRCMTGNKDSKIGTKRMN